MVVVVVAVVVVAVVVSSVVVFSVVVFSVAVSSVVAVLSVVEIIVILLRSLGLICLGCGNAFSLTIIGKINDEPLVCSSEFWIPLTAVLSGVVSSVFAINSRLIVFVSIIPYYWTSLNKHNLIMSKDVLLTRIERILRIYCKAVSFRFRLICIIHANIYFSISTY